MGEYFNISHISQVFKDMYDEYYLDILFGPHSKFRKKFEIKLQNLPKYLKSPKSKLDGISKKLYYQLYKETTEQILEQLQQEEI